MTYKPAVDPIKSKFADNHEMFRYCYTRQPMPVDCVQAMC